MNTDITQAKVMDFNPRKSLKVSKATENDIDGIIKVASSVGNGKLNSNQGFLMDNYGENKDLYIEKFKKDIHKSDLFYVIKSKNNILGFLLAYTKDQWLDNEPKWISDTKWKNDFDKESLNKFVILEKIAVNPNLTGRGLGSRLFTRFRKDSLNLDINNMFSETILSPKPNFASMKFAMKQRYKLAGIRYEEFKDNLFTTIIYHRRL